MSNKRMEFPTLGSKRCRGCQWDQSDVDDEALFGENFDIITHVCFECRRPYKIWMSKKWTLKDQYKRRIC